MKSTPSNACAMTTRCAGPPAPPRADWFRDLAGGSLTGQRVLEGRLRPGLGVEVLLDRLDAEHVRRVRLDSAIDRQGTAASARTARVELSVGDACEYRATRPAWIPSSSSASYTTFPGLARRLAEIVRSRAPRAAAVRGRPAAHPRHLAVSPFTVTARRSLPKPTMRRRTARLGVRPTAPESPLRGHVFVGAARKTDEIRLCRLG